jgi:hypothetical protein
MKMEDFEKLVDENIIPHFREELIRTYREVVATNNLEEYLREKHIEPCNVVDFGLPSGTLWIVRNGRMCYTQALKRGLQLPTLSQIQELSKCRVRSEQYDSNHAQILGLNGTQIGVCDNFGNLCFWISENVPRDNNSIDTYSWSVSNGGEVILLKRSLYIGSEYSPLFVLPKF